MVNNMPDKIVVAYVADEHYFPYLMRSMESVRKYNKDVRFVVMSRTIREVPGAEVYNINPDTHQFKYREKDRMREGVYYKLFLPELPFDKVLYIDCDVLCQRPLNALWAEKCDFICATESHNFGKVQAAELHLNRYALTGMMLLNLKALREMNFTQKCLDKLAQISPKWHDETVINLVMADKLRFIDKKYNYCRNRIYDDPIREQDAYLLHYVGRQKSEMLTNDFAGLQSLKSAFAGKDVAIVGNSSALLKKSQGKAIDAHSVVCRFNKGFPCAEVGEKTTVLFMACTLTPDEVARFGARYTVRRSKLCDNVCDFNIDWADRQRLKQGGKQPSTGLLAIDFALSAGAKSIDLYGFDFFKNPTYYNPVGYQTLHNGNSERERILELAKWGLLKIK